jgi:hypothetical protein
LVAAKALGRPHCGFVAQRKIGNLAILRQTFVSVRQCMARNDVAAYILARRQTAPDRPSQ